LTGPEREYADYLRDILDAAGKAGEFVGEMDAAAFEADDKTVFAVIRALEIVGEAAKRVPPSIQKRYPNVPWRQMMGMRDKVIHGYFGVNLRRVFETVQQDLPPLRERIASILEELESGSPGGPT